MDFDFGSFRVSLGRQLAGLCPEHDATPSGAAFSLSQIVEAGKKATVLVDTGRGSGSAFCIHPSGLFVTNSHVVRNLTQVTLWLPSGQRSGRAVKARVVRQDFEADLALLRLDPPASEQGVPPLPTLPLGDTRGLLETQSATVFGFPFGKDLALRPGDAPDITVTTGHITSLRHVDGELREIQLDAQANPGNSGGPVLNSAGQVIGVLYAGIEDHPELSFAISVDRLKAFLAKPQILFDPPTFDTLSVHQPQTFRVEIVPFDLPAMAGSDYSVSLSLSWRFNDRHASVQATPQGNNVFLARVVPMPVGESDETALQGLVYSVVVTRGTRVVAKQKGLIFVTR